jgi:hypothetical protein
MLASVSDVLKVFLQIAQVIALVYAGYKFTRKPHDTLESRVDALEEKTKDIELSMLKKDERIRELDEANGVIMRAVLALIEFEIQYCLTENKPMTKGLERAKESLDDYFASKK